MKNSLLLFVMFFLCSSLRVVVKNLPAIQEKQETQVQSLLGEDPREEGLATHSSILAWGIPRTEDSGRLQSIGSQRADMTEAT